MHELEARMEVKEVENVGAEQEEDKEVEEPRVDKQGGGALEPGEGDQSDAKAELECGAAKDDLLQGGGALDTGEGDCEIGAKVKVEVTCVGKVVTEIRVGQGKVERIDVFEVRVEEFADLEVVQQFEVEEPRIDKDGLEYRDTKDELEFSGAKKELQELRIPESNYEEELNVEFEPLRFVKAGCRALGTNSEYG